MSVTILSRSATSSTDIAMYSWRLLVVPSAAMIGPYFGGSWIQFPAGSFMWLLSEANDWRNKGAWTTRKSLLYIESPNASGWMASETYWLNGEGKGRSESRSQTRSRTSPLFRLDADHMIIPADKSVIRITCFLMPERNLLFLIWYENNIKISTHWVSHSNSHQFLT